MLTRSPYAWPSYASERETEAEHADEPTTIDNELMHDDEPTTTDNELDYELMHRLVAVKVLFKELSIVRNGHLNRKELFYFALVVGHCLVPEDWDAEYQRVAHHYYIAPEGMGESTFQLFSVEWECTTCCDDEDLRSWMKTLVGSRQRRRIETYQFMANMLAMANELAASLPEE